MEIKAQVHNIHKLSDYFFVVPDYQREYVWRVEDQVEQFLSDIDHEFEPGAKAPSSYFIGSIIVVRNGGMYEVIDGQQRLTTIVLSACAMRDLLQEQHRQQPLEAAHASYLKLISEWLSRFDPDAGEERVRLELQYTESRDFLQQLIAGKDSRKPDDTASIQKMRAAYQRVCKELQAHAQGGVGALVEYVRYFVTKIDLVVIESESIGSALKIFETINQRGAGLNAMDLFKNLLFREAKPADFEAIKQTWHSLMKHLERAGEGESPLRFLRYFLMARHHAGILREDQLYRWIISPEGQQSLDYARKPKALAVELEKAARRYAELVKATGWAKDGGDYPSVTRIGFINKHRSRLHLVLLMALHEDASTEAIEHLARNIESFFFFSNTLGIQTKYNEPLFTQWAVSLRGLKDEVAISAALRQTLLPYLRERLAAFTERFLSLRHADYDPLYRLRYVLGQMENTLRARSHLPLLGLAHVDGMQVEHILVQTPRSGHIPAELAPNVDSYKALVHRLGNVTLLESTINQAVNSFNDLSGHWFADKQAEYLNSGVLSTQLLNPDFAIGQNTQVNQLKPLFDFKVWNGEAIERRQKMMLDLALDTWRLNGERLDALPAD